MMNVITGPLRSHASYATLLSRFSAMSRVSMFQLHWFNLYLNNKENKLDTKPLNSNAETGQF